MKVIFGVTSPMSAMSFLRGQMNYLTERGHEVGLMCPSDPAVADLCADEGVRLWPVAIHRRPHAAKEAAAMADIIRTLRSVRPDVVILGTPKMSVLGLIVAAALRVPRRVYLVHGLRHEGASGVAGAVLRFVESLNMALATHVVAVSPSVAAKLTHLGRRQTAPICVLGHGSPNGVSLEQYVPASTPMRRSARAQLGILADRVALFVGRMTADKGIAELLVLADRLRQDECLVIAGPAEPSSRHDEEIIAALARHPRVRVLGEVGHTPLLYAASDILVLPTRREGLPTVVLEAGASGLPTVAYDVTGCTDAVRAGSTGELVEYRDPHEFAARSISLLRSPETSAVMGQKARDHIEDHFDQALVWRNWSRFLDVQVTERA